MMIMDQIKELLSYNKVLICVRIQLVLPEFYDWRRMLEDKFQQL